MRNCILLCACGESELLPQNPDLPADVFTSCLTTPIKVRGSELRVCGSELKVCGSESKVLCWVMRAFFRSTMRAAGAWCHHVWMC